MTVEELVSALHPPRLPVGTATLGPGALIAAFGLGLLVALVLFAIARPAFRARLKPARPSDLVAGLAALPPEARPLAAARLFARLGAAPPDSVTSRLYRPEAPPLDAEALGEALRAAWAGAGPEARRGTGV